MRSIEGVWGNDIAREHRGSKLLVKIAWWVSILTLDAITLFCVLFAGWWFGNAFFGS